VVGKTARLIDKMANRHIGLLAQLPVDKKKDCQNEKLT
jgi:hypothetical protein